MWAAMAGFPTPMKRRYNTVAAGGSESTALPKFASGGYYTTDFHVIRRPANPRVVRSNNDELGFNGGATSRQPNGYDIWKDRLGISTPRNWLRMRNRV